VSLRDNGLLRRAKRALAARRKPQVRYRDGIPNRADEILAEDATAQALIEHGFLEIGRYSYFAPTVRAFPGEKHVLRIGSFSSVSKTCEVYLGGHHRTDWVTSYGMRVVFDMPGAYEDGTPFSRGDVTIGSDCWVCDGSVVLSGVTIGDGAVVGTHSVVTKDVPPYAIVAGNPARQVGQRFPDDQIEALLRIRWWDWPIEQILEHVEDLCSDDVAAFIERFDPARR